MAATDWKHNFYPIRISFQNMMIVNLILRVHGCKGLNTFRFWGEKKKTRDLSESTYLCR